MATNNSVNCSSRPPATSTYAGNPNGNVAGVVGDFCINTTSGNILYLCVSAGTSATAVWSQINSTSNIYTATYFGGL